MFASPGNGWGGDGLQQVEQEAVGRGSSQKPWPCLQVTEAEWLSHCADASRMAIDSCSRSLSWGRLRTFPSLSLARGAG